VDHFYPIPVRTIKRKARKAGATQQVQLNLGLGSRYRNDISRLFPVEDDGGSDDELGRGDDDDGDVQIGPDWDGTTHHQQSLNPIARSLGTGSGSLGTGSGSLGTGSGTN